MKCKANVTVDKNGEIVIPEEFFKVLKIKPGDELLVLGNEDSQIAMMKDNIALHKAFSMLAKAGMVNGRLDD